MLSIRIPEATQAKASSSDIHLNIKSEQLLKMTMVPDEIVHDYSLDSMTDGKKKAKDLVDSSHLLDSPVTFDSAGSLDSNNLQAITLLDSSDMLNSSAFLDTNNLQATMLSDSNFLLDSPDINMLDASDCMDSNNMQVTMLLDSSFLLDSSDMLDSSDNLQSTMLLDSSYLLDSSDMLDSNTLQAIM